MLRKHICLGIGFVFTSIISSATAQTSFFTPTLSDCRSSGWSLSIGGAGLGGARSPFHEEWIATNSFSGDLDTLYSGTWTPDGGLHIALGIGRVFIAQTPILADRFSISFVGSRRTITETFDGVIDGQDTVVTGTGSSLNVGVFMDALKAIRATRKMFLEVGIGGGYKRDFSAKFDFATSTPLSGVEHEMSPYSGCFEFIIGAGFKISQRKYLRVKIAADMLQLAPINGTAKLPWRVGEYRPYRAMISLDLFGEKPIQPTGSCAAPTHSEKSKELFGKEMRGRGRAKNKRNKKGS